METHTTPAEYLLLIRGTHWDKNLSPEEIRQFRDRWTAWIDRLTRQGKVKASQPLAPEGKLVYGRQGRTVVDGPYAESKEAIAGYFLVQVQDLGEALEMAKGFPVLDYGATIEVRPVLAECPTVQRAMDPLAHAGA